MQRSWGIRVVAVAACAAAAGTAGVAGATASGSAPDPGGLAVVASAPPAWLARTGFDVDVVVRNASERLMCSGVDITLTWRSAGGTARDETVSTANTAGSATAALHVAAATVRAGVLQYVVTATQRCGWLDGSTTFVGRSPATGWSAVTVLH